VSRYVRVADRPALTVQSIDVRCPRCASPPGIGCRRIVWQSERVVAVDGRIRRAPAGPVVTDVRRRRAHPERRAAAAAEQRRITLAKRGR
jgi:hypothetical protein